MNVDLTEAIEAIREFPFWDYGMDEVDPKSKYAEWVPDLAKAVEAAVREQIAREIEAAEPSQDGVPPRYRTKYILTHAEAAALARGQQPSTHERNDKEGRS